MKFSPKEAATIASVLSAIDMKPNEIKQFLENIDPAELERIANESQVSIVGAITGSALIEQVNQKVKSANESKKQKRHWRWGKQNK